MGGVASAGEGIPGETAGGFLSTHGFLFWKEREIMLRVRPKTLKSDRLEAGPTRVLGRTLSPITVSGKKQGVGEAASVGNR